MGSDASEPRVGRPSARRALLLTCGTFGLDASQLLASVTYCPQTAERTDADLLTVGKVASTRLKDGRADDLQADL
jgi:hypothetical protein